MNTFTDRLKRNKIFLFSMLSCLLMMSCATRHRVTGWYLYESETDRLTTKPLFVAADFQSIDTTSNQYGNIIDMKLNDSNRALFADVTENNTGNRIGFLFRDSVVMSPRINARIEGGRLQIISPDPVLIKEIYDFLRAQSQSRQ